MQANFQLKADPIDEVRFEGDLKAEVRTTIKLTNKTQERKAFKVKCTRNDIFRIRPPVGTLDPNESKAVVPEGKRHHFAIYHIAAPNGVAARAAWSGHHGEADGVLRMWAVFKDGPAQSDSKKEDEAAKDGNTPPHLMSGIKKPDEPKPDSKHDSKPEPKQEPKPEPKSESKPAPAPEKPDGPKKPEEAVQAQQAKKNDPNYATLMGLDPDPFGPKGGPPKIVIKAPDNPTRVDPKADQYKTLADLDKVSFTDDKKKFKPGEFKAPGKPKEGNKDAEYATLANLDAQQVFDKDNKKDK
ncbi:MSP domain protein 2 [Aphelenchoides avenae]|nr:MSP domain protein 2 [Aphelenchus avenae]